MCRSSSSVFLSFSRNLLSKNVVDAIIVLLVKGCEFLSSPLLTSRAPQSVISHMKMKCEEEEADVFEMNFLPWIHR